MLRHNCLWNSSPYAFKSRVIGPPRTLLKSHIHGPVNRPRRFLLPIYRKRRGTRRVPHDPHNSPAKSLFRKAELSKSPPHSWTSPTAQTWAFRQEKTHDIQCWVYSWYQLKHESSMMNGHIDTPTSGCYIYSNERKLLLLSECLACLGNLSRWACQYRYMFLWSTYER